MRLAVLGGGIALMRRRISRGNIKEQRLTFHLPLCTVSLILSLSSSLSKGPEIRDQSFPSINHSSCKKLSPLSDPIFHFVPCLKICFPLLILAHVPKQHLLGFAYLSLKPWPKVGLFLFSFANLALLEGLNFLAWL